MNATVTASTFARNQARGAVSSSELLASGEGGGAIRAHASLDVVNSTLTANLVSHPTATGGGINGAGAVTLTYVTIVANDGTNGANVSTVDDNLNPPGTLTSFGSVIAQPQSPNCALAGASTSLGYNFRPAADNCGLTDPTDVDGDDPLLGPLADNGGPTPTMLPQQGSPLIDAIPEADCDPNVTDDQRGLPRPADGNNDGVLACDIGAVEVQPPAAPDDGDRRRRGAGAGPQPVMVEPRFTG